MLKKLGESVKELFENSSDENTLKKYAGVCAEIDKANAHYEDLEKRNTALLGSLKEATLNSQFNEGEVVTEEKPKGLTEIINKYAKIEEEKK